ncbi:hypothetical protein NKOR_05030 [Candidatus Nitrosopumilus koreensis AR1]|uniref:Uncharacterized protein n=1 Tax=Candidatus Nitrosopumilus koreensis AR1 TaxID=1229908 RepID=K0B711_9ARCH|nr:hypothetical protein NKOR_05030 [Candidatus Nitrosopumilus koreensis AR1]
MSHPFDGVPTFALTDHSLDSLAVKHTLLTKNFSILKSNDVCLLITCKGIQKNNHREKCSFLYDGDWGDSELIEHQKFHESQNQTWLGFDTSQSIGKFSGRDGKSS